MEDKKILESILNQLKRYHGRFKEDEKRYLEEFDDNLWLDGDVKTTFYLVRADWIDEECRKNIKYIEDQLKK